MKPSIRVLLVDDNASFRDLCRITLMQKPEFEVVGEASNGMEAIQKLRDLDPDLILLDIGLPDMSGIEVAGTVRNISPRTKILVLSQSRSPEIVMAALRFGAHGYVFKADAGAEFWRAVESVLAGRVFVSISLTDEGPRESSRVQREPESGAQSPSAPWQGNKPQPGRHHDAGFFSNDQQFLREATRFVGNALRAGNAAIVVATEWHRLQLVVNLWSSGLDMEAATEEGRYTALDPSFVLMQCMTNGRVDPDRFMKTLSSAIQQVSKEVKGRRRRVTLFAECAPLLIARGNIDAALQVERLSNELLRKHDISILCGYSHSCFAEMDASTYAEICDTHSMTYSR